MIIHAHYLNYSEMPSTSHTIQAYQSMNYGKGIQSVIREFPLNTKGRCAARLFSTALKGESQPNQTATSERDIVNMSMVKGEEKCNVIGQKSTLTLRNLFHIKTEKSKSSKNTCMKNQHEIWMLDN